MTQNLFKVVPPPRLSLLLLPILSALYPPKNTARLSRGAFLSTIIIMVTYVLSLRMHFGHMCYPQLCYFCPGLVSLSGVFEEAFHVHFRTDLLISPSRFYKEDTGILAGPTLNLLVATGTLSIFTMLILVREHVLPCH